MGGTLKRSTSEAPTHNESMNKRQKKESATTEYEKMLKSQEPLSEWLQSFQRDTTMDSHDATGEDEVGTFIWKKEGKSDGKEVACCLTALSLLLDTEEVTSSDSSSALKEAIESQWGPISEFPDRCEELGKMMILGAKLARDAGIDKIKTWDADDTEEADEEEADEEEADEEEADEE
jgi:hypothetical protein